MPSTSIYVVTNGKIPFLWLDSIPFSVCVCVCVCIPHLLYPCIYLWNLAYFHVLVIINNAVMNIGVHVSFHVSVSVFFDCNTQMWNCWKHETFILWLHQFTTPPTKLKSSLSSISFPPIDTTWWYSFWRVWGSNSLWLAFALPWWLVMLIIFSCVCGTLRVFFGRMSMGVLRPLSNFIVSLMLSYINSLYILDINFSSDTLLTNIFPHSIDCLFILLLFSFSTQELFSLI